MLKNEGPVHSAVRTCRGEAVSEDGLEPSMPLFMPWKNNKGN
jgi:hypothetical protein